MEINVNEFLRSFLNLVFIFYFYFFIKKIKLIKRGYCRGIPTLKSSVCLCFGYLMCIFTSTYIMSFIG